VWCQRRQRVAWSSSELLQIQIPTGIEKDRKKERKKDYSNVFDDRHLPHFCQWDTGEYSIGMRNPNIDRETQEADDLGQWSASA
jgi:hypothetical protein